LSHRAAYIEIYLHNVVKVLFVFARTSGGGFTRGVPVNGVSNHRAIGFYLGDDCYEDMIAHMPNAPKQLEKIQRDGLVMGGKHLNIQFWLGGDLKFLTSMLALTGNSSIYPCPFCLVFDKQDNQQLSFTQDQLYAARVEDRTIEMTLRHSHVHDGGDYECILCKNVNKKIKSLLVLSTSPPLFFENDNQRRQWQQLHVRVYPQRRPFFHFIPVSRVVIDTLHIELRIIPLLWKVNVSSRCRDATHLANICQWVFGTQRILISKNTTVQNSRGVVNTIGTESWQDRTCRRNLIIHEDVLREVSNWGAHDDSSQDIHIQIWEQCVNWLAELKYGLPIDTPNHWDGHADRLKVKAESFLAKFQRVAGASGFTPYMHCLIAHVPNIVRRFGGMVKGCSKGVDALN
jgi:hypothetical protein